MTNGTRLYEEGYALIVGVGGDLPVTIKDANGVYECLADQTLCAYPEKQIQLLTSAEATQTNIIEKLDWLAEVTNEDTSTLVYFSGHGISSPEYYLLPYGYDMTDLSATAIEGSLFSEKLKAIRSKKMLVVLDCCHAGGQAQLKDGQKPSIPNKVLEEFARHSGRVIIASSYQDEKSYTGDLLSVFTQAFLEGLVGCGTSEQDGYSRVLDIYTWTARMVPDRTKGLQHPMIKVRNMGDNFPVAWYAGGEKSPRKIPVDVNGHWQYQHNKSTAEITAKNKILSNYKKNLLLIETRMSEYVDFTDIPLQLLSNKETIETQIKRLEQG